MVHSLVCGGMYILKEHELFSSFPPPLFNCASQKKQKEGTAACPSSDTLFMAWALMESKIHDERSRKVARALMHRAVALNPRRHAAVLSWRVFLDWKEAGEAAMEAVRSAVSNMGQSTTSALVPATPTVGITMTVSDFRGQNSPFCETEVVGSFKHWEKYKKSCFIPDRRFR